MNKHLVLEALNQFKYAEDEFGVDSLHLQKMYTWTDMHVNLLFQSCGAMTA
jgi:hypothetical protein